MTCGDRGALLLDSELMREVQTFRWSLFLFKRDLESRIATTTFILMTCREKKTHGLSVTKQGQEYYLTESVM